MDTQPTQNLQPEIQPQKLLGKTWQIVALTVAGVLVVGSVAAGSYYLWQKSAGNSNQTACTMEAKQCEDGSYVGRTGPNCEFAACPLEVLPSSSAGTSPSASISASSSASPDETAGWQTLDSGIINTRYNVTGKYPNGWVKDCNKNECEVANYRGEGIMEQNSNLCDFQVMFPLETRTWKNIKTNTYKDANQRADCQRMLDEIEFSLKYSDNLTADWQTYKNDKYGFEVRYPKDKFTQCSNGSVNGILYLYNIGYDCLTEGPASISYVVNISWHETFGQIDPSAEKRQVSIDGINYTEYINKYKEGVGNPAKVCDALSVVIPISGGGIMIGYCDSKQKSFDDSIRIFNQILSTFKFIPR